jgi:O-antigen/teichoic acid export membrane protein
LQQGITNTTLFRLLSTIANFLIALFLARFLGPTVKGEATIFITTVTFLVFFCSFLGGQVLIYLVPRFRVENLIMPAYIWTVGVAGISFILFNHFAVFTWRRSFNICTISVLCSVVNINEAVLLAKKEIGRYNVLNILPVFITTIGLALGIFVYQSDSVYSIYGYLYPLYVAYTISALVSFFYARKYIRISPSASVFDDIDIALKYGMGYQIFELLQLLNFRLYFFLLYHLQGPTDLGLLSIGVSILEAVWILGRSVFVIHYSGFSNNDNHIVAVSQTLRYIKIVTVISVLLLAVIALCPSSVYGFVFGASFAGIKYQVKWLFPGILMYSIALVIQSIYLSQARYGKLIFAQLVSLVISVTLCYLWIPHYYYSGACAAASAAYITCAVIMLAFFMLDYKIPFSKLLISRGDILFINNVLKSYTGRQKDS